VLSSPICIEESTFSMEVMQKNRFAMISIVLKIILIIYIPKKLTILQEMT